MCAHVVDDLPSQPFQDWLVIFICYVKWLSNTKRIEYCKEKCLGNNSLSLNCLKVLLLVGDSEKSAFGKPNTRTFKLDEKLRTAIATFAPHQLGSSFMELLKLWIPYCDALLSDKDAMDEIKNSQLIIGDSLYLCSSLVAAEFSLPHVTIAMSLLSTPTLRAFGVPSPPSYVPQAFPGIVGEFSFFERVQNIIGWIGSYVMFHYSFCPRYGEIKTKHNIAPQDSCEVTLGKVDLIIGQMEFPIESPRPLLPSRYINRDV